MVDIRLSLFKGTEVLTKIFKSAANPAYEALRINRGMPLVELQSG